MGEAENAVSHGLAGGVLLFKRNDTLTIDTPKIREVLILSVHAQRVVKTLQELAHHLLDGFEIQHHIMVIQRFRREYKFYAAGVSVRKLATAGMLGEQVPALQFNGFANTVHSGFSKRGLRPF